jgi:hypothetical protein
MNEKFIGDLFRMVRLKCQECGQYYGEDDIEIIKKEDGSCFLNIYCPVCNRRSFAIALLKQEELKIDHLDKHINVQSVQTDSSGSITTSDVTNMHTFLDNFDGDFNTLFEQNN